MGGDTGQSVANRLRAVLLSALGLRIEHLWMLVPAAAVIAIGFHQPLRLLDFWWHLKVGEVIVTSRAIPRVDLFSFTRAGQPFIYQNWLGEVLYYLTYQVGGLPLVIALNTALLLLAFVFVFHMCLEATPRMRVAVLCSLVAVVALGFYSHARPQTYSFALLAIFYWVLWAYRDGRRDLLWALPLLMVLWVNLHGAFVLGIGMMGIVLAAETVRRVVRGPQAGTLAPSALAKLAAILALTVLASLANPHGYQVYAYVRQLQVDPSSQLFVTEWQVPDVKDLTGILIFFGPFFLTLVVLIYSNCAPTLTELGLFLTFAVLGLAALRNGVWFALIVAPMLARHVAGLRVPDLLARIGAQPYLHALERRLERRPQERSPARYRLNWVILICLALFTLMLSPWVRPHLDVQRVNPQLVEQQTPVGAMDYIAQHHLVGNIFHPQEYGDYLIWRLWPQQRSFFDGRVHLYPESFVRDHILTFHDENWESRLAKYDIKYLLLPKHDEGPKSMIEAARSSTKWTLLYEDDISVLFEKQGSR